MKAKQRKSKNSCHVLQSLISLFINLTCLVLSCFIFCSAETLVQRHAKRAKTSTGDDPPASTVANPETIAISPEPSPRRSPQHNPKREFITHFLLASVGVEIFTANISELVVEERRQEDQPEANLDVPSSSTTQAGDGSPQGPPSICSSALRSREARMSVAT